MTLLTTLGPVFYKLVYMSLTGLAAGAIVLLLRRLADKRFSPVWKYAMWLLVLAALVIPWRPQSRAAVLSPAEVVQEISFREDYNRAQMEYNTILAQAPQLPHASPEVEAARRETTSLRMKTLAFDELLPLLWLFGTAGAALFMGIGAIQLRRKVKRTALACDMTRYEALLARCQESLGMKRRVRVVLQSHVGTPALMGLLRPVILLPEYAANMSDARLEYVILHELSHLRRGDGLVNALLLALRALYWFNPLVWLLLKFVREDMELANDAAVLKSLGHEARKEYSLSLVEVLMGCAAQKQKHTMLCMTDGKKNIERRIGMIQLGEFFKKRKWVIAIAGVLVIGGIAALFLTTGTNGAIRIDSALEQYMEEVAQEQYAYTVYPPGFLITAVKIHGAYRENDVTKVFVTTWHSAYREEDDGVREFSGGVVPAAISCRKEVDGTYTLIEYKESSMGADWEPSIREFCVLPSGRQIRGLADRILKDYGDNTELGEMLEQKLAAYLASSRQGETKRFQYNKLVLEITNVARAETKTGMDHDTDPYEYTVYTLYPGARLTVINADMLDGSLTESGLPQGQYYIFDASKIHSEQPEEYVFLEDGMEFTITPDMTHVGIEMIGILRFLWLDDTQPKPADEFPLTLEQSVAQAILQSYDGLFNAELHRTLFVEEVDGLTTVYVSYEAARMGWEKGRFAVQSATGSVGIFRFKRDGADVYTLASADFEIDPKAQPDKYAIWQEKTSRIVDSEYTEKPREILFGYGQTYETEPVNWTIVGKYLPEGVFSQKYMPNFEERFGSDGVICYYWSKTEGEGETLQTIRKIELMLCDEGVAYYHFKDYGIDDGYRYAEKHPSLEIVGNVVAAFAQDFWQDGDKLLFKHAGEGAVSLYDPGRIENWQATRDGKTYNVMVDLLYGAVIYASVSTGETRPVAPEPTTTKRDMGGSTVASTTEPPGKTRPNITITSKMRYEANLWHEATFPESGSDGPFPEDYAGVYWDNNRYYLHVILMDDRNLASYQKQLGENADAVIFEYARFNLTKLYEIINCLIPVMEELDVTTYRLNEINNRIDIGCKGTDTAKVLAYLNKHVDSFDPASVKLIKNAPAPVLL